MRERDVFGKKINRVSFVLVLVFLFGAVIAARFGILSILDARLASVAAEQAELQGRIDAIVAAGEARSYHEIGEIVDALPNAFDQIGIAGELALVRDLSGFAAATGYGETFLDDADSPVDVVLAPTVKAVRIAVTMDVADPASVVDYLDHLDGLERIYYVDEVVVDYHDAGAYVTIVLYTFYNDVTL